MITDIAEQKRLIKASEDYLRPLIDRWDEDYRKRYVLEEFKLEDSTKGKYDYVTSNLSRAEADKLISSLATAEVNISLTQYGANTPRRANLQST